jgi:hypothetical protein
MTQGSFLWSIGYRQTDKRTFQIQRHTKYYFVCCLKMTKTSFKHRMQLQVSDSLGFLIDGTQFWITIEVSTDENTVLLQLPTINFQTISGPSDRNPVGGVDIPGGYIYTVDGFLPSKLRPRDLVYRSIVGASDNGRTMPFTFNQFPNFPIPISGYIVSITNGGGLVIQAAGQAQNVIPPGPQTLLPSDVTYIVKAKCQLCKNIQISPGTTEVAEFQNYSQFNNSIRDSHVNDAYDNVVAWTWTDNSNIPDKTTSILNTWVAIGHVDGKNIIVDSTVQLTNYPPNVIAWDTAVAINRTNPQNIVVSWERLDRTTPQPTPANVTFRAASFDGGKTWPINGPTNIQPTGGFGAGDNRGVAADKFGNIWYSTTNLFDPTETFLFNTPTFWISSDGGVTFTVAYTASPPINVEIDSYDYPQYCFGGDGQGNYGIWWTADYYYTSIPGLTFTTDIAPAQGFIPITGLGQYGAGSTLILFSLANTQYNENITASLDGRVWVESMTDSVGSVIAPVVVRYKSPGPQDSNYAGPWELGMANELFGFGISNLISYPFRGNFPTSAQSSIYDDKRQALYALVTTQFQDYSQNMRIYFQISRDNGQTWSEPIDISTTDFANRSFTSMALDTVTGNLIFGWYDGRNDPTYKTLQYFGAIITNDILNKLVREIPVSNPVYTLPPATTPITTSAAVTVKEKEKGKMIELRRKIIEKRLGTKRKLLEKLTTNKSSAQS